MPEYESNASVNLSKYVPEAFIAGNSVVYGSVEFSNITRSIAIDWAT